MAYFLPSSIQKRLLRYALSRLELLDTDALDLEKLDIEWGSRSSVELHDVNLRKPKLTSLLHLPPTVSIEQAQIGTLRITVPADLRTSSIVVEVRNVGARLRLHDDDKRAGSPRSKSKARRKRAAGGGPPANARTGGLAREESHSSSDGSEHLPSPRDLARSFLEEEPVEEREQLEAALNARSVDLSQSAVSSDAGSDETPFGTGTTLALPGFLAAFLKGIGDRLQVSIKDVVIKLDTYLQIASDDGLRSSASNHAAPTTFSICIEDLNVTEASTVKVQVDQPVRQQHGSQLNALLPTEVRRIGLIGITGSIATDSTVFESLSQAFEKAEDLNRSQSRSLPAMRDPPGGSRNLHDSALAPLTSFLSDEPANFRHLGTDGMFDSSISDERDDDGAENTLGTDSLANLRGSISAQSSVSVRGLLSDDCNPTKESDLANSGQLFDALRSFEDERLSNSQRFGRRPRQSYWPATSRGKRSPQRSRQSSVDMPGNFPSEVLSTYETASIAPADRGTFPILEPPGKTSFVEDLEESKYFSHEEAESLYMSVRQDRVPSPSDIRELPGRWEEDEEAVVAKDAIGQTASESASSFDHTGPRADMMAGGALRNELPDQELLSDAMSATKNLFDSPPQTQSPASFCGPNAVVREIAQVSDVSIEVFDHQGREASSMPQFDQSPAFGAASEYRSVPGAFSTYAENTSRFRASGSMNFSEQEYPARPQMPDGLPPIKRSSETKVIFGSITARIDVATARLFLQLSHRIQAAFEAKDIDDRRTKVESDARHPGSVGRSSLSIRFGDLVIAFTENLRSLMSSKSSPKEVASSVIDDSLFVLKLKSTTITVPELSPMTQMKFRIGKLSFGFPQEDIVRSMTRKEMPIADPLRSKRKSTEDDVEDLGMEISKTDGNISIHLLVQPLLIELDMQKIDSTLGSIGGLSGLLELGSSIMSDSTIITPNLGRRASPRTVRFDASTKPPSEPIRGSQTRVNVRVGGAAVTLRGQSSSLVFESSAVKVVSRSALMGVQIDEMKLHGPYVGRRTNEAPLLLRARDTRLKFLPAPEEHDLTRLISLLTPSKDKFEDDDDFLVDTLVKQRKKGAVLRCNISRVDAECLDVESFGNLQLLKHEMSKLSAVTKYLPEETRPGLMTLAMVDKITIGMEMPYPLGRFSVDLGSTDVAHVTAPALIALAVGKVLAQRGDDQPLVTAALQIASTGHQPMVMARMIEDELDPTIKLKLWNTCFEYSVPFMSAVEALQHDDDVVDEAFKDPALLGSAATSSDSMERETPQFPSTITASKPSFDAKPLRMDIAFRDCAIGLNPLNMPSKALFVLGDAAFVGSLPDKHGVNASLTLRKSDLLIIDNVSRIEQGIGSPGRSRPSTAISPMVRDLCNQGFVSVSSISAAQVSVKSTPGASGTFERIDVEFKDDLFVFETCADSQQTVIETLNALKPPRSPSTGEKYRTEVAPVEDMMASFTGDAFLVGMKQEENVEGGVFAPDESYENDCLDEGEFDAFEDSSDPDQEFSADPGDDELEESIYGGFGLGAVFGSSDQSMAPRSTKLLDVEDAVQPLDSISGSIHPNPLPQRLFGQAKKWDSSNNRYLPVTKAELARSPLQIHVKDMHIIWNLYDGYDWERTRDTINRVVQDVEMRAEEKRRSRRVSHEVKDDESVIGDFLFNSIYIGVPANQDPKDLALQINRDIDDLASETASHTNSRTPSYDSGATSRPLSFQRPRTPSRKLKLERSKRHKIAVELRGLSADIFFFESGSETQSSIDARVRDFEIFDHVPTSTWKKFLTYMHDAGPREDKKPMVHLEVCDVRPVPELTASELVIRVTILPLRLHVDQDALDFITRFFEFKDTEKVPSGTLAEEPYLQRVEIRSIPVKLDYKPKKVDYAGIRSGRTSEFMNFFILDGAEFVLRHVILYGCSGFLKMHHSLEDIWMPDVKKNQLPSVLSGLNGVRTLVNVGTGVRDLIQIPIREYRKDGRIFRSISRGALSFARTTGGELTRFGAKLAIGAQTALQGAEGLFTQPGTQSGGAWEEADTDPEEKRAISNYANQPAGILQGLTGAARSLERDLLVTRDVIIAISGEVRESNDAEGVARAVARHAPTLILRPMIGASRAFAQTLMGAGNTVDPENKRRVEDKYKRY